MPHQTMFMLHNYHYTKSLGMEYRLLGAPVYGIGETLLWIGCGLNVRLSMECCTVIPLRVYHYTSGTEVHYAHLGHFIFKCIAKLCQSGQYELLCLSNKSSVAWQHTKLSLHMTNQCVHNTNIEASPYCRNVTTHWHISYTNMFSNKLL